jgi:hypothetical protein
VKFGCKTRPSAAARRRGERGYAILLVLFLLTLLLLTTISVAPNILTAGRREREKEMIWRGNQYARGVKMFYRKTGKFPTSMDDLIKPKLGNIRFMRQAYKDPMNSKDGEWRLIYVSPTGQLIGSLKPPKTIQLGGVGSAAGTIPGTPASQAAAQSLGQGLGQAVGQVFGNSGAANSATSPNGTSNPNGTATTAGQPPSDPNAPAGTATTDTNASGTPGSPSDAATEALLASDPTTVIGGNIIGVGSKVNHGSIIVYDKAKNYKQFEFIWDPSKDAIVIGGVQGQGQQIGTPAGQPQQSPFGGSNNNSNTNTNPGNAGSPSEPPAGPPESAPGPPPQ